MKGYIFAIFRYVVYCCVTDQFARTKNASHSVTINASFQVKNFVIFFLYIWLLHVINKRRRLMVTLFSYFGVKAI